MWTLRMSICVHTGLCVVLFAHTYVCVLVHVAGMAVRGHQCVFGCTLIICRVHALRCGIISIHVHVLYCVFMCTYAYAHAPFYMHGHAEHMFLLQCK